jgi:hypothetical protein
MKSPSEKIAVCTVATGPYIYFWKEQLVSWKNSKNPLHSLVFHIFTDQIEIVERFQVSNPEFEISLHAVPTYPWPEVTALRYEMYYSAKHALVENVILHIDADMLVKVNLVEYLIAAPKGRVSLVMHPGFYRPKTTKKFAFYMKNKKFLMRDLVSIVRKGGIGAWETDKVSSAYVERRRRKTYFCGGIWFAGNEEFHSLVKELTKVTRSDLDSSRSLPIWHDESYLNAWASKNEVRVESAALCYVNDYIQLSGLNPMVIAVTKDSKFLKDLDR